MTDRDTALGRGALRTPRAAAVAGILFALLYGASLVLVRLSIPPGQTADTAWIEDSFGTIALALNLVPYAGIAFLWFIGVIRDRFGAMEDRLFATVFLGSGLLFLGLTFVGVAMAGGALASYSLDPAGLMSSGVYGYSRAVMYNLINIYAIRMAGVFMISLATIWLRTGLMHRGWAFLTYALALVLLLSVSLSAWITLTFPGWVFVVSVYYLIRARHDWPEAARGEAPRVVD
jgi:hypothetical protein